MTRMIHNTTTEARHPWPEDVFLQGGDRGVVISARGGSYRTAFVEAFPGATFLRGEGPTLADAEDAAWTKYTTWLACDGTGQPHGPLEACGYTNGAGFCTRCGTWMSKVLPAQPEGLNRKPTVLERALLGDGDALGDILNTRVSTDDLPAKETITDE